MARMIYKGRQDLKLWRCVFLVGYIHPKGNSFWQPVWGRGVFQTSSSDSGGVNSNVKNWICVPSLVRLAAALCSSHERLRATGAGGSSTRWKPQKSPNCRTLWSLESANWIIRGEHCGRLSLVIVRLFILLTHAIPLTMCSHKSWHASQNIKTCKPSSFYVQTCICFYPFQHCFWTLSITSTFSVESSE